MPCDCNDTHSSLSPADDPYWSLYDQFPTVILRTNITRRALRQNMA